MSKKISDLTHLEPPFQVLGTDLIPIARPTTSPKTNFSVSVDRIINRRKFCLISNSSPQWHLQDLTESAPNEFYYKDPWNGRFKYIASALRFNACLAGDPTWFETELSGTDPTPLDTPSNNYSISYGPHQRFKPNEAGFYKVDGCFVFSHNSSKDTAFRFIINVRRAGGGSSTYELHRVHHVPVLAGMGQYSQYAKFIFDEVLPIYNVGDFYTFSIAVDQEYAITIPEGTDPSSPLYQRPPGLRIDIPTGINNYYYNHWYVVFEKL